MFLYGPTTSQLSRGHQVNTVTMSGTATPCMGFPMLFQPQDHVLARATEEDFLSRQKLPRRWKGKYGANTLWHSRGGPVCLCQSSTRCPLWFSLMETTSPWGQDALAHPWPDRLLCAFPPFPLISVTLHRVQQGNHSLLLVAPNWPGRPWFPGLHRLMDRVPWCLPRRQDLLLQLGGHIWHPSLEHLQLWVLPLRGLTHS